MSDTTILLVPSHFDRKNKESTRNVFRVICYEIAGPNSLASVLLFVCLMVFNATFSLAQYLFSTGYARLVDFHTVKLHVQTNNRKKIIYFSKSILQGNLTNSQIQKIQI